MRYHCIAIARVLYNLRLAHFDIKNRLVALIVISCTQRFEVEENRVDCGYFVEGDCVAQPFAMGGHYYKPTEEEKKRFCENENEFKVCPRFTAYQEHLKAIGLRKN